LKGQTNPVSRGEEARRLLEICGQSDSEGQWQKQQQSGRARLLYADAVIEGMMCSVCAGQLDWLKFLYECASPNNGQIGAVAAL